MKFWLVDVVPRYENSAAGWYIFVKKNVDGICGCESPKIVSGKSVLVICMSVCVFLELQLCMKPYMLNSLT